MSTFLLKETSCGPILVRDHLPLATTKSAHFGWSLSGGSTVPLVSLLFQFFGGVGWNLFCSWVSRIDLHTKALLDYFLKSTNIILYLKGNAPWQVVQLRDDLKGAVFAGKVFRIRFGGEKLLDRMNYDYVAVS